VAVSFILRITLLFHPITDTTFIWTDEIKILYLVSDVLSLYTGILWLYLIFISNGKYLNYGYIIFGLFVALFLYIASKSILNEYGGALPKIGLAHKNFFYLDFYFFTKTKR
jgi:hypothetical protein